MSSHGSGGGGSGGRESAGGPASGRSRRASIYVHFPWCLAKCPYCDFVSYATAREAIDHEGYADAVVREIDARAAYAAERLEIGSVFFAAGTPTLWHPPAPRPLPTPLH